MSASREFSSSAEAWYHLKRKSKVMKKQELKERLAHEIQQIRNRKVNETIIRVPSDCQEWYFEKLESNGIWEQVFQNLTSLSDLTSAYFTCEMFHDQLEKRRTVMLLPQVFGVLRRHNYLKHTDPENITAVEMNKDVFNLRLVSKAWKEATEDQFLAPTGFLQPNWHLKEGILCMNSSFKCRFKIGAATKDVDKAMEVLRTSHSCPSLLKIVEIDIHDFGGSGGEATLRNRFHSKLAAFFDRYGGHVWALSFGCEFNYECLWMLVSRMPNLKELFLDCYTDHLYDRMRRNEDNERRLIAQYPFPTIPFLTRIAFDSIHQYKLLKAEILQSNPSLKTVSIDLEDPDYLREFFPVLTNIPLECFDFSVAGEDDRMNLHQIQPLCRMNWPLKSLRLTRWDSQTDLPTVNGGDLFQIINRFNGTLEEVSLDTMVLSDDERNVVVEFPKLRTIKNVWTAV